MTQNLVGATVVAVLSVWCALTLAGGSGKGSDMRIVHGQNSTRGQFPHQATLFMALPDNKFRVCGGSLISDEWVLTAAHCVDKALSVAVYLGVVESHLVEEPGRIRLETNNTIIHPMYFARWLVNDIALVRLPERVQFTEFVKPIRLPNGKEDFHGVPAIATGFGHVSTNSMDMPPVLQWIRMETINNWQCALGFGNIVAVQALALSPQVICARNSTTNASGCYGDSGGPLFTEDHILIGVLSFVSNHGCDFGYPTAFARVTAFLGWIRQQTGIGNSTYN